MTSVVSSLPCFGVLIAQFNSGVLVETINSGGGVDLGEGLAIIN